MQLHARRLPSSGEQAHHSADEAMVHAIAHTDSQRPHVAMTRTASHHRSAIGSPQNVACLLQKQAARVGQFHAPLRATQQGCLELGFQLPNLMTK